MKELPDIPNGKQIQEHIKKHVQDAFNQREYENQYNPSPIPAHDHDKINSSPVNVFNLSNFPSIYGQSGKFLTNNQSILSWGTPTFPTKFGGTGADGVLSVSSGTTTIDLGGHAVVIKNYSSISVTGTGAIAFTNAAAAGTTIIFRCSGNCTITGSGIINFRGGGGKGGDGLSINTQITGAGASGNGSENTDYGTQILSSGKFGLGSSVGANLTLTVGGGGGSLVTAGTAGTGTTGSNGVAGTILSTIPLFLLQSQAYIIAPKLVLAGAGGGGGLQGDAVATSSTVGTEGTGGTLASPNGGSGGAGAGGNGSFGGSGGGGAGGGAIYIEVGGALNFTGTIDVSGGSGGAGANTSGGTHNYGGSGGGGGSGGSGIIVYNTLTANSGTISVSGGTGGTGGTGSDVNGKAGGTGGSGFSLVTQNLWFL